MAGKADLINSKVDSSGVAAGSPEAEDDPQAYTALDAAEAAGAAGAGWMADGQPRAAVRSTGGRSPR